MTFLHLTFLHLIDRLALLMYILYTPRPKKCVRANRSSAHVVVFLRSFSRYSSGIVRVEIGETPYGKSNNATRLFL
jgi:hypothetical protein